LQSIERELEELKRRVEVLEGRPAAAAPAATPQGGAATPPACPGWDRLKMSLTQSEVRGLLGEPARIDATPLQIIWRYPCGRAYFDGDTKRFVGAER
jgi:hypothetical protein